MEAGKAAINSLDAAGSQAIQTISNGSTAWGVYGCGTAVGGDGRRLHYVELDENFGQEHVRSRREARRKAPERELSFLSDDEGLKRRLRSELADSGDYQTEGGYLTGTEADGNGLVFGAFEEDLKHFKDKYFFQPGNSTNRSATNTGIGGAGGRSPKRNDGREHPQQLKSQNVAENVKRTQYATLKFDGGVNI